MCEHERRSLYAHVYRTGGKAACQWAAFYLLGCRYQAEHACDVIVAELDAAMPALFDRYLVALNLRLREVASGLLHLESRLIGLRVAERVKGVVHV